MRLACKLVLVFCCFVTTSFYSFYFLYYLLLIVFVVYFDICKGLILTLSKQSEHRMVRHEAAEALGAIGGQDIEEILQSYRLGDKDDIVVESCEVALDAMNYWDSQFTTNSTSNSESAEA